MIDVLATVETIETAYEPTPEDWAEYCEWLATQGS
jgi:hypothetical protein